MWGARSWRSAAKWWKRHERSQAAETGRLHAAREHSHRRLALSGRHPRRQLQFPRHEGLHPDAGAGQVRRLLHGRSPCGAEHAGERAEAQPHRHLVRALHPAVGAGGGDRAHRLDGDRLDHLRRALPYRPPVRVARPHQRRPRRLEHRHHRQPGRGADFRSRRGRRPRRALSPRPRVLRRGHRAVGLVRRRRLRARRRERHLLRPHPHARAGAQGRAPAGARAAEYRPADPGLAG